jgi:hypothetical protein
LGFTDVGPSGVVLFGDGGFADARVQKVGWYSGGHGAALQVNPQKLIDNRVHLLAFADSGRDMAAGEELVPECGSMENISRATPYAVWLLLAGLLWFTADRVRKGWRPSWKTIVSVAGACVLAYSILDVL